MPVSVPGLIFEIILFLLGVYLYLYARGFIKFGDEARRKKIEEFRQSNGLWMRLAGLALMALMAVNIYLHLSAAG